MGKIGSMREIELTDMRSVLHFMIEYPIFKNEDVHQAHVVFGDETNFA
jgi:hypothetical protein